jgi:hypothetical protein
MMFRRQAEILLLLIVLVPFKTAHAQYELPDEVFRRTIFIRSGNAEATAFRFDQAGRIYLVTTGHFGKSLPLTNAVVQVWHNQAWNDLRTVRTLFPANKEVDLAILETDERIARPYTVVNSSEVLTTEQSVWFMGWPGAFKLPVKIPPNLPVTSRPVFPEIPVVKIGKISAINPAEPDSFEINFKGYYSVRLAGGPVIYWSSTHKDFELLGVIKRDEHPATVSVDGEPPQKVVKSGILKAYSVDLIEEVISKQSPPVRSD